MIKIEETEKKRKAKKVSWHKDVIPHTRKRRKMVEFKGYSLILAEQKPLPTDLKKKKFQVFLFRKKPYFSKDRVWHYLIDNPDRTYPDSRAINDEFILAKLDNIIGTEIQVDLEVEVKHKIRDCLEQISSFRSTNIVNKGYELIVQEDKPQKDQLQPKLITVIVYPEGESSYFLINDPAKQRPIKGLISNKKLHRAVQKKERSLVKLLPKELEETLPAEYKIKVYQVRWFKREPPLFALQKKNIDVWLYLVEKELEYLIDDPAKKEPIIGEISDESLIENLNSVYDLPDLIIRAKLKKDKTFQEHMKIREPPKLDYTRIKKMICSRAGADEYKELKESFKIYGIDAEVLADFFWVKGDGLLLLALSYKNNKLLSFIIEVIPKSAIEKVLQASNYYNFRIFFRGQGVEEEFNSYTTEEKRSRIDKFKILLQLDSEGVETLMADNEAGYMTAGLQEEYTTALLELKQQNIQEDKEVKAPAFKF